MTLLEKLAAEHPKAIDPSCWGGAVGCPSSYGYEFASNKPCGDCVPGHPSACHFCWNREIPEEKTSAAKDIEKLSKTFDEATADISARGKDMVNHPGHYESGKFECIDVMLETQGAEAVAGFCICNAFKYLYRHKRKNGIEDVKKAQWYINKYLEIVEDMHDYG